MTTVKEAKEILKDLIKALDHYDDNKEFLMEIDDNCGGSYTERIDSFHVYETVDDKITMHNLI